MTSSEEGGLIGYNTTPNSMQAESQSGMCVLSYAAFQRLRTRSLQTKPGKTSHWHSRTLSRQSVTVRQKEGIFTGKGTPLYFAELRKPSGHRALVTLIAGFSNKLQ